MRKLYYKLREDGILQTTADSLLYLRRNSKKYYSNIRFKSVNRCDEYLKINPAEIQYYLMNSYWTDCLCDTYTKFAPTHELEKGRFDPEFYTGLVIPGSWDLYKNPYEHDIVYRGLKNYYKKGKPFKETQYWNRIKVQEMHRGDSEWAKKKLDDIKALYKSINDGGYVTQYELGQKDTDTPIYSHPHGIEVNIGRNGEFIFNNKSHRRLAFSKLLELEQIPVIVIVRHSKWQSIRKEINDVDAHHQLDSKIKKYINHPDIKN